MIKAQSNIDVPCGLPQMLEQLVIKLTVSDAPNPGLSRTPPLPLFPLPPLNRDFLNQGF